MLFPIITFITAITIAAIAAWFSVVGLMAIFTASAISVAIMAVALEVGKLVSASWVYRNWTRAPFFLKSYLTIAVIVLMFITSMGIFGFLSKAHLEQTAMSGEQVAQITVYESKLIRLGAKITRWSDEIDRLNKGENIRIDNIVAGEEEQLQRLYTRIDTEKESLRLTAKGVVEIQQERLQDSDQRTKDDIALVNNREGDNQEEIDVIRKRERGVAWVARRDIGKIQNQLKIDLLEVDKRYASDIDAVNNRIATLKEQSNLKTEDIDTRINALEGFIETEQVIVDKARENKLVLEKTYRQLEVEVGPVKYIAEFIYGDDAVGMLDSAVRGVILLLIFVFDPLAVLLIIAGNMTIRQAMGSRESSLELPKSVTTTPTKELVKDMELDIEVAQNLGILKEKKDDVIPKEEPIKEEKLKEVLEEADPEVREEVAKKLEEESQTVLVDKENTPILEPLINKGKSILTSIVSGKSKKISWIDTPHEPKH